MAESVPAPAVPSGHNGERAVRPVRRTGWMENVVLVHVSVMIVGTSWALGGQAPWVRTALEAWGTLGILLFLAVWFGRNPARTGGPLSPLTDLWPLLIFDLLVGASCFNPTFQTILRDGVPYFALSDPPRAWLPSCARPDLAWHALWLFNGIVLSAYGVTLAVRRRRTLRRLLFIVAANAMLLAIFGTFQKLVGAGGLYFDLVPTPQNYFFATFIYHNHWGAFTLLNTATALGLLFHTLRRHRHRDVWHSPVPAGAIATLLLAATIPLSASRSSSALICLLLLGALLHLLVWLVRLRRESGQSTAGPVAGIILGTVVALAAIVYLGRAVIVRRAALTVEQVNDIRAEDSLDSRLVLYRDTWRMAQVKPWFGWGLDSYGDVFRVFNSQRSAEGWMPYYREAHNDWLQALAETGFVGTTLLVLLGAVILWRAPWRHSASPLPRYLVAGCGLVLLYATFEFPFANASVMIGFWTSLCVARHYLALDAGSG